MAKPADIGLSKRLNALMDDRKLLGKDLAATVGVSPGSLSFWRTGRKLPSLHRLIALSKALDVSTDYLLGLTDEPQRGVA